MGIEIQETGEIAIGKSINPFFSRLFHGRRKKARNRANVRTRAKSRRHHSYHKIKHRTASHGKLKYHKTKHRGGKAIHYTKHGQPYRILANGRARFIKK